MKKYGKTEAEAYTEKLHECRDIVKKIIDFGVTENQKIQIIKLIALELEDNAMMKEITSLLKQDDVNTPQKLIYTE
jgi:hypothetical protein